jgi:predicted transcriptional regulator
MNRHRDRREATQPSVLAQLRHLVPRRPLRYSDAFRIAELQATRLLALARIPAPPVPYELIALLPHVEVVSAEDVPISGSAHWDGHRWLIVLNSRDSLVQQRYSLAHELKHVIDHTTRSFLYTGMPGMTAAEQAERAADYFAGCLLMPEAWLRDAWLAGCERRAQFGRRFGVPATAAEQRLSQIGLAPLPHHQVRPASIPGPEPAASLDPDAPIGAET